MGARAANATRNVGERVTEPMVTAGSADTKVLGDGWTVSTKDSSDASHWEHSVAVHEKGVWVLTAVDGGAQGLKPFGITPVAL